MPPPYATAAIWSAPVSEGSVAEGVLSMETETQICPPGLLVGLQVWPPSNDIQRLPGMSAATRTPPCASDAIQCHCLGARRAVQFWPAGALPARLVALIT